MKSTSTSKGQVKARHEELRAEYKFDYAQAKPNRFAGRRAPQVVVVLDSDVARVFKDTESVNRALRALLAAVPQRRAKPAV